GGRPPPRPVTRLPPPPLPGPRPAAPPAATPIGLPAAGRAFPRDLVDSRLLEPQTAKSFLVQNVDHLGEYTDGQRLGQALVVAGHLTDYQLCRVLAGTTHGLVLGNYRVLDRLGGGSVGVVFRGEHVLLKRAAGS